MTITVHTILDEAAALFGISYEELVGPRRQSRLVRARHAAMYLVREFTSLSYPAIGELFGGRDHTTVMHGVEKVRKQVEQQRQPLCSQLAQLSRRLQSYANGLSPELVEMLKKDAERRRQIAAESRLSA